MTQTVPEGWEPPSWISGPKYSRRELEWLAATQQDRITKLQIELRATRARLAMYDQTERQGNHV